jgi:hypothetical protein
MTAISVDHVGPICDFDCEWISENTPNRDWRPDMDFTCTAANHAAAVAQAYIEAEKRVAELVEIIEDANECAFPCHQPEEMGIREGYFSGGMSLRQFAAIQLRVPDSGDEHIDSMIRQANRRDFAGQALAGLLAGGAIGYAAHGKFAAEATKFADALIEELNQ